MTKYWINETSSKMWRGNRVGIIRVEDEIKKIPDFLRFSRSEFGFLASGISVNQTNPDLFNSSNKPTTIDPKIRNFLNQAFFIPKYLRLQKILGYSVSFLYGRNRILDRIILLFSSRFLSTILKLAKQKKSLISSVRFPLTPRLLESNNLDFPKLEYPFHPGDCVISVGLDWDTQSLEILCDIKKEIAIQIITCIYDLIPVTNPEFIANERHSLLLMKHFTLVAKNADLVFVNSKTVEDHFKIFCLEIGVPAPNIARIPWGFEEFSSLSPTRPIEINNEVLPFVLAVGTFEIRKNYSLVLNMVNYAHEKQIAIPKIVIVGRAGWGTAELQSSLRLNKTWNEKVLWLSNVSDSELKWLYNHATAYINPSHDEGFGLPIVEAINAKVPVILSDIAIFRELFSDATFASPNDPVSWVQILHSLTDAEESTSKKTFKIYSWDEVRAIVLEKLYLWKLNA